MRFRRYQRAGPCAVALGTDAKLETALGAIGWLAVLPCGRDGRARGGASGFSRGHLLLGARGLDSVRRAVSLEQLEVFTIHTSCLMHQYSVHELDGQA